MLKKQNLCLPLEGQEHSLWLFLGQHFSEQFGYSGEIDVFSKAAFFFFFLGMISNIALRDED